MNVEEHDYEYDPGLRRFALTAHVTSTVGWLGAIAAFLALAVAALISKDVKLGPEVDGQYSVIEGLSVGERVVTEGSFLLRAEWLKVNPTGQPH